MSIVSIRFRNISATSVEPVESPFFPADLSLGVDSLIGLLHHSFQLSLSTHHLGEIDLGVFSLTSLFQASGEDMRLELGSDSPKAGSGPGSGNKFSLAL